MYSDGKISTQLTKEKYLDFIPIFKRSHSNRYWVDESKTSIVQYKMLGDGEILNKGLIDKYV